MQRVRQLLPGMALSALGWLVISFMTSGLLFSAACVLVAVFAVLIALDTGTRPYQQPYRIIAFLGAVAAALSALTVFTADAGMGLTTLRVGMIAGVSAVSGAWYFQRRNLRPARPTA